MFSELQNPKIKYFIYTRKSTEEEDRQLLSIEAQLFELREYAKKLNLEVVEAFTEAKSAYEIGRPKFAEMLKRIEKKEASGVLCWQPNRISRNPKDAGEFIYQMSIGNILELRTPYKTFTTDSSDQLLLTIELGMAKKDSDDKSQNVKRGNKTKIRNGYVPCMAIQGYLNLQNPNTKERYIDKDPDRFPLLQQAIHLIIDSGYSPMEALHTLNDKWNYKTRKMVRLGGKKLSRSAWYKLLSNPFIYGYIKRKDGEGWGKHPALITLEQFNSLQIRLGKKTASHYTTKDFPYKKVIKCGGCGGTVTAHEKWQIICSNCKTKFAKTENRVACTKCGTPIEKMDNPKILHYTYLSCAKKTNPNCTEKALRLDNLETTVEAEINKFEIDGDFLSLAVKYLHEVTDVDFNINQKVDDSLNLELDNLQYSLKQLLVLKVSPENRDESRISEREYVAQRKDLLARIKEVEDLVADNNNRVETSTENTEKAFTFARYANYWLKNGDSNTKTQILQSLGLNLKIKDKKLCFDKQKHFYLIEKGLKEVQAIKEELEPMILVGKATNTDLANAINLSWRRERDSNPRGDYSPQTFQICALGRYAIPPRSL
jgi:site-specific DNA recombinase